MKVSIKANKLEASSNNVRGICTVTYGAVFTRDKLVMRKLDALVVLNRE